MGLVSNLLYGIRQFTQNFVPFPTRNTVEVQGATVTDDPTNNRTILDFSSGGFTAGGDLGGTSTSQEVLGIRSIPITSTPPTNGEVPTYNSTSSNIVWSTPAALPQRPASDSHTLLDYRCNETQLGVLVNHGSYGTSSSPVGPQATVTTASFVQPATTSTVTVSVANSTGYSAGEIILIGPKGSNGAGANYYYCTAVGSGTLTLKNLAINGSSAVGATIAAGSSVAPNLDLLTYSAAGAMSLLGTGPYDYAQGFVPVAGGTSQTSWNNYAMGSGGCPDFVGLTGVSLHVLYRPNPYTGTVGQELFGYSVAQSWGSPFQQLGASIHVPADGNSTPEGWWGLPGGGQTWTIPSNAIVQTFANMTLNSWNLLSITLNLTTTSNAVCFYKNGVLVQQANISATGSMAFGSGGYWYVGNPNYSGGDTGDGPNGSIAMARFENTVRSPSYIAAMAASIFPGLSGWPQA